jgi:hypothetical protein
MSRSLSQVMSVRPGMDIDRPLLLAEVFLKRPDAALEQLANDFAALPGVADVAFARRVHLSGHGGGASVNVERPGLDPEKTGFNVVNHRYFAVSGARILSGRPLEAYDGPASTPVVVVNQLLASRLAADGNAVGRFLRVEDRDRLIVGVAENGPVSHVRENPAPYLYLPATQAAPMGEGVFLVQTGRDPALLASAVRETVRAAGASFELFSIATWDEHLRRANDVDGTVALLARSLAGIGLFLAAGGLFGVLLYSVGRRTREFGIRLTLGADRGELARLVTRESLRLCAWAVPAGLVGAIAFGWAVRSFLFGVGPANAVNLALAAGCVLAIALLASWWPARQAGRVDPAETPRYE